MKYRTIAKSNCCDFTSRQWPRPTSRPTVAPLLPSKTVKVKITRVRTIVPEPTAVYNNAVTFDTYRRSCKGYRLGAVIANRQRFLASFPSSKIEGVKARLKLTGWALTILIVLVLSAKNIKFALVDENTMALNLRWCNRVLLDTDPHKGFQIQHKNLLPDGVMCTPPLMTSPPKTYIFQSCTEAKWPSRHPKVGVPVVAILVQRIDLTVKNPDI